MPAIDTTKQPTEHKLRYGFGKNWLEFLENVDPQRVAEAEKSIQTLLGLDRLDGLSFLDIGSGSGLFSLAARRLGARVHSFDFDAQSVQATNHLRNQFFPSDANWVVQRGSVLDESYLAKLGKYDVVYSWGVLHHTGQMYRAIENAVKRAVPGGLVCIALYCKTPLCGAWRVEKRIYTHAPRPVRAAIEQVYVAAMKVLFLVRGGDFAGFIRDYDRSRGMEFMTNVRDWLGGYPYESISENEMMACGSRLQLTPVRRFCQPPSHGFLGSHCDEYVFRAPS